MNRNKGGRVIALMLAAAVAYGGWLVSDPGRIPLLDANRTPLAEDFDEGYCAGEVFMATSGYGEQEQVCGLGERGDPAPLEAQPGFCRGIMAKGLAITLDECMAIMEQQTFWPTLTGTITNEWNKAFPYPGQKVTQSAPQGDQSRTGERGLTDRDIEGDR